MDGSDVLQPGVSIKPKATFEDIKKIVYNLYGYKASKIIELNSYDDKNYRVFVENSNQENTNIDRVCENGYVLKIINSLDSKKPHFIEAQNAILLHLGAKNIPCSKPIVTKEGLYIAKIELTSGEHVVRLLEFIEGSIFHEVKCTPDLLFQAGELVSKIDTALEDFYHPAYENHNSVWLLESVPQLTQFLFAIKDETKRNLVLEIIEEFKKRVLTLANTFKKGMIHGDFNEQNIIVDQVNDEWKIKAVIDFGDSSRTCYLYEVAITMAYMILQAKDIYAGGYVLAGYSSVRKLTETEYQLLKVCIAGRLCQSLVLGAYSHMQDPANMYILRTSVHGWALLDKLWNEQDDVLLENWRNISKHAS